MRSSAGEEIVQFSTDKEKKMGGCGFEVVKVFHNRAAATPIHGYSHTQQDVEPCRKSSKQMFNRTGHVPYQVTAELTNS